MGQKRMREMATEETVRGERKRIHKENDLVSGQVLSGQEGAYYTVGASWGGKRAGRQARTKRA